MESRALLLMMVPNVLFILLTRITSHGCGLTRGAHGTTLILRRVSVQSVHSQRVDLMVPIVWWPLCQMVMLDLWKMEATTLT